jgi:hypothetical protein
MNNISNRIEMIERPNFATLTPALPLVLFENGLSPSNLMIKYIYMYIIIKNHITINGVDKDL